MNTGLGNSTVFGEVNVPESSHGWLQEQIGVVWCRDPAIISMVISCSLLILCMFLGLKSFYS